jgi:hypothetical protein
MNPEFQFDEQFVFYLMYWIAKLITSLQQATGRELKQISKPTFSRQQSRREKGVHDQIKEGKEEKIPVVWILQSVSRERDCVRLVSV